MTDIRELYAGRVEAAAVALKRGDRSEAERLFSEALAMGEEHFGAASADLAVPLNELSRLYVRASEHARAKPLLERLLEIRRASGANHPDVATVLAGLAAVRRGLGDDAAAEDLYRQALAIREVAHAPDHMAVVVTLEQLADTCAALRKFGEASALIERALPAREKALGAEHATVVALRARLAELAKPPAPAAAAQPAPVPAPAPAPIAPPVAPAPPEPAMSNQLVFIYEPEKPKRRASVKRDRAVTPPFSMAVAAASMITAPAQAAVPAPAPAPIAAPSLIVPTTLDFESAIVPFAGESLAVPQRIAESFPRRSSRVSMPARAEVEPDGSSRTARRYGMAAGGFAVVAGGLFFAGSHFTSRAPASSSETQAVAAPATAPALPAASVAAPAMLAAARTDSVHVASTAPAPAVSSPKVSQPEPKAEQHAAAPTLPSALPAIGGLAIPVAAAPNVDSLLRVSSGKRDADADQIVMARRLQSPTIADDRAETSPTLIGSVPQPRYPDVLRAQRMEGAVVVQFLVGTDGRVDPSTMKVVRSPHELFTAAVRNVLPSFRFEPARAADGKPRAETVQYSIQFSAAK